MELLIASFLKFLFDIGLFLIYCVGLRCTAKWFSYTYTYNHFFFQILSLRLLQNIDPLEKGMATHSSILAWRIPGMEEPDGLLSMGSHRVGHD